MEIKSKYQTYKIKKGKTFSEPSKAIQSLKGSTLIDSYLRKYNLTGILGDPSRTSMARYGDFAAMPDFQEMQNRVARTTQFFEALPSDLRKRFGNNVSSFVAFISDPNNFSEAQKLGLGIVNSEGEAFNVSEKQDSTPAQAEPAQAQVTKEA